MKNIIVSKVAFENNPIQSNIDTVEILIDEGFAFNAINKEARASYVVSRYWNDYPSFIFDSKLEEHLVRDLKEGFRQMKAVKHLAYLEEKEVLFKSYSDEDKALYLNEYSVFRLRKRLSKNYWRTLSVEEPLEALHIKWLKSLDNLKICSFEEKYAYLSTLLGRNIMNVTLENQKIHQLLLHWESEYWDRVDIDIEVLQEIRKFKHIGSFNSEIYRPPVTSEILNNLGYEFYIFAVTACGESYLLWNCPKIAKEEAVVLLEDGGKISFVASTFTKYLQTLPYTNMAKVKEEFQDEKLKNIWLEEIENFLGESV